jgi:hypothetical protein
VVDGLKLAQNGLLLEFPLGTSTDAQTEVNKIIESLQDALAAMSDAAIAESVFQLARGNTVRASAALDAISRAEALPPELQVVDSQRTGTAVTHRLVILLDSSLPASKWPSQSLRALAEPNLNAWLGSMLGDPSSIVCGITYRSVDTLEPSRTARLSALDLGLAPLDLVALVSSREAQASELDQRLRDAALQLGAAPSNRTAELDYYPTNLAAGEIAIGEFLDLAHALRDLVFGAHPLDSGDLTWGQGVSSESTADLGKIDDRWSLVNATLATQLGALKSATTNSAASALRMVSALGIAGAVPLSGDPAAQLAQAGWVAAELDQRLKPPAKGSPNTSAARLRSLLGADLPLLAPFTLDNTSAGDLDRAFSDSVGPERADDLAAMRWVQDVARVRAPVARFERAVLYAEVLGNLTVQLQVAQLPYQAPDRWLGLSLADGSQTAGGKLSIVALKPEKIDPHAVVGLVVDSWVDVIPSAVETTAIAFHYDALTAQPPQAILLAIPPDPTKPWSLVVLEAILLETLELAKIRAVDWEPLQQVGQFLPAVFAAYNPEQTDAISEAYA